MPPEPDCKCKVINGRDGNVKDNSSWILGRIVRDFEYWRDVKVKEELDRVLGAKQAKDGSSAPPPMAGLVVSIYRPKKNESAGVVKIDAICWIGIPVMILQLGIAAIPCGIWGDWSILLITASGIALSVVTAILPQWKKEKWACRTHSKHPYILTRGNGAQHAIVILGNGHGLNLSDLASGQSNVLVAANRKTRAILLGLAMLWILLLITASGLQTNTWFLHAVGGLGMLQNIYAAGAPRNPENFGIHLDFVEVIGSHEVILALHKVEEAYSGIGLAMFEEFFSGGLPEDKKEKWEEYRTRAEKKANNQERALRNGPDGDGRQIGSKTDEIETATETNRVESY